MPAQPAVTKDCEETKAPQGPGQLTDPVPGLWQADCACRGQGAAWLLPSGKGSRFTGKGFPLRFGLASSHVWLSGNSLRLLGCGGQLIRESWGRLFANCNGRLVISWLACLGLRACLAG